MRAHALGRTFRSTGTGLLLLGSSLPAPLSAAPPPDAQAAVRVGEYGRAEALLGQWLARRPADEEARFLLARVLLFQAKYGVALSQFDRLLRASPGNADYLLGKGQALLRSDRAREALPVIRRARALAPNYEDLYRVEIQTLLQLRDHGALGGVVAEAKRRFPNTDWDRLAAAAETARPPLPPPAAGSPVSTPLTEARAAVVVQQYDRAERLLRQWLLEHPADGDALFLLARVLAFRGNFASAIAEFDRLLAGAPRNVDFLLAKAQALVWADRPTEALPLLQTAKALAPRYEDLYRVELQALRRLGDRPRFAEALRDARRLFPGADFGEELPPAVPALDTQPLERARQAVRAGDLAQGELLLRAWVEAHPTDEESRFALARLLMQQGKIAAALSEYDRLQSAAPENVDYLVGKGQALLRAGRAADALALLRRARELSPQYEDVYRLLLQAYTRVGDQGQARATEAEARRLFPQSVWPEMAVATVPPPPTPPALDAPRPAAIQEAVRASEFERAETLLREWLEAHVDDEEARYLLARVLTWQGKADAALEQYDRLLARTPDSADYLLGRAQALVRLGRGEEALALLARARARTPQYADVYRLELQILRQLGRAAELAELQRAAIARFPDTDWTLPGPAVAPTAPAPLDPRVVGGVLFPATGRELEIETGFSYESLTNGFANWRSYYLDGKQGLGGRRTIYGQVRETDRFRLVDQDIMLGYYTPLGGRLGALAEVNGSPTHQVLPIYSALGQLQYTLGGGWGVQAGFRHTEYDTTIANRGILTLERYLGAYRLAYNLSAGQADPGGFASAHSVQVSRYYGDRNYVTLNLASGTELENVGPNRVLVLDVRSIALYGRHWFLPRWGLTYALGVSRQGELYTRRGLNLGVRHQY